jgi:hypothetical protein
MQDVEHNLKQETKTGIATGIIQKTKQNERILFQRAI